MADTADTTHHKIGKNGKIRMAAPFSLTNMFFQEEKLDPPVPPLNNVHT